MQLNLNNNPSGPSQQVIDDYTKFFNGEKNDDMLKYAYMLENHAYENLITQCEDYYPYKVESACLNIYKNLITRDLQHIDSVCEIGPGSESVFQEKMLPIIKNMQKINYYIPIDVSEQFSFNAQNIAKRYLNIKSKKLVKSFLDLSAEDFSFIPNRAKALFFMGTTFGNLSNSRQAKFLSNIYKLMNQNDRFIFSADITNNLEKLSKAYMNSYIKTLLFNIISYFQDYFQKEVEFSKYLCYESVWDEKSSSIYFNFKTVKSFTVEILGKNIFVEKGKILHAGVSKKFSKSFLENTIVKNNFLIMENIIFDDSISIYICKKI